MGEAERIKDRLRACKTVQEIHDVADQERSAVKALAGVDRTQAIHVANLKSYMLTRLEPNNEPS